ncbi:MAG TPA: hypothetical protein VJH22_05470 [Candidatus Nanoarchaeia archaeon]|nr:hypothetical protein [Candidatus Nanoarchaeia archaeon]
MSILGMQFNKISVNRNENVHGQVNAEHNFYVSGVSKSDMKLGKADAAPLKVEFEWTVRYEPNAGSITIGGYVLYLTNDAESKEILEKWTKEKKLGKQLTLELAKHYVPRCNLTAAMVSREVNLPPPFPLPRVKSEGK